MLQTVANPLEDKLSAIGNLFRYKEDMVDL